jgi:hypothetical protein
MKPDAIPARVTLPTGDEVELVAFRGGTDPAGITLYELALPDGSPFTVDDLTGLRVWLEQLPEQSSVSFRAAG